MRTIVILSSGLLVLAGLFLFSRLFLELFPSAVSWATYSFIAIWFFATAFNLWVGVTHAGYSVREELPIMLLLFAVPAGAALLARWKFV
ncbi:MAG TPA: hypothetical protein PKH05_19230 [Nitrospira sp.]|nr:hypothetical protein [Nitrospira sp.]